MDDDDRRQRWRIRGDPGRNGSERYAPGPPLVSGCAETNIQAIHRLQPAYAGYRDHLQRLTATPPAPPSVTAPVFPRSMDPPPRFNERQMNDPAATAEVLFVADPADPDPQSSLHIRSPVQFCLAWTGPNNPPHPEAWGELGPRRAAWTRLSSWCRGS